MNRVILTITGICVIIFLYALYYYTSMERMRNEYVIQESDNDYVVNKETVYEDASNIVNPIIPEDFVENDEDLPIYKTENELDIQNWGNGVLKSTNGWWDNARTNEGIFPY